MVYINTNKKGGSRVQVPAFLFLTINFNKRIVSRLTNFLYVLSKIKNIATIICFISNYNLYFYNLRD